MITLDKLKLYLKYDGDIDMWSRVNNNEEQQIISEEEWSQIQNLLQELYLIEIGKTSEAYESEIRTKLESIVATDAMKLFYESAQERY